MQNSFITAAALLLFLAAGSGLDCREPADPIRETERQAAFNRAIEEQIRDIFREKVERVRNDKREAARDLTLGGPDDSEVMISDGRYRESEIHAAVNPANEDNIVIAPIRSLGAGLISMPLYYTRDHGQSWQRSEFEARAEGGGDPMLAFDADGTLYFSWIAVDADLSVSMLFASSRDGGASFGPVDSIFAGQLYFVPPDSYAGSMADKQWMAVDRSSSDYRGSLYAIFLEFEYNPLSPGASYAGIYLRRKPAGNARFVPESIRIAGNEFSAKQFAGIDVDLSGRVHAFFWGSKDFGPTAAYHLWHAFSDDGAASFSPPRPIAAVRFPTDTRQTGIPSFLPQRLHSSPQFAVDNHPASPYRGNMYAVWASNDLSSSRAATLAEPFHIYFCRSSDRGESWSSPRRVNDDDVSYRADHLLASVSVNSRGTLMLSWYDGRAAPDNRHVSYYMALSEDGGASISANRRVASSGMDINAELLGFFGIGDYNKSVATSLFAVPIWADGRGNNGGLNVYAAFIPLDTSGRTGRVININSNAELSEIQPNPLRQNGRIQYRVGRAAHVILDIVDVNGRHCITVEDRLRAVGSYEVEVDLGQFASGLYFCRLRTGETSLSQQILIRR